VAGGVRCAERGREHHAASCAARLARSPARLAPPGLLARPRRPWPPLGRSSPTPARALPKLARALAWPQLLAPAWSELARAHGPAWLELGLTDLQLQRQETEWLRVVCAAQTLQRFLLSIIQLKY
jgi:hypothetical protein